MQDKILKSYIRSLLSERGGLGKNVDRVIAALGSEIRLPNLLEIVQDQLKLEHLGSGSFRAVYAIDDDWVLKVAVSSENKARLMNKIEADPKLQSILSPYVPRTVANGRYFGWLIVERCQEAIHFASWLAKAGVSHKLVEALYNNQYLSYNMASLIEIATSHNEFSDDIGSDLIRKVMTAHEEMGINLHDIRSYNIGYGNDGRPVILDTGMDKDRSKHNLL